MARHDRKRWREKSDPDDELIQAIDQLSEKTALQPSERLRLETEPDEFTGRVIDLVAPIGRGQRVLLPSPPKAGKTTILQRIAKAVDENNPDVDLLTLLVDERVEEVTDFKRNVPGEVYASSIDQPPDSHVETAENTFQNAVERVLRGEDVLVLLDSLTRLARTYNKVEHYDGRTLSGGLSAGALDRPRMLFGSARRTEDSGSLTIVASCLVDTGSRMDEVIFQEFKGTGNCELVLDREIAQHRIWPAVDIDASGTRQEHELLDDLEQEKIPRLRRKLAEQEKIAALKTLRSMIRSSESNRELLENMA
ncbi:MAG: transcription termination factor Rho [Bradymonadaceae bacterium]